MVQVESFVSDQTLCTSGISIGCSARLCIMVTYDQLEFAIDRIPGCRNRVTEKGGIGDSLGRWSGCHKMTLTYVNGSSTAQSELHLQRGETESFRNEN